MENDVFVLILGTTDAAYACAHRFYRDYGIRPTVMDETVPPVFASCSALHAQKIPFLTRPHILHLALDRFYEHHAGKIILLLPATPHYAALLDADREALQTMFILPYAPLPPLALAATPPTAPVGIVTLYGSREGEQKAVYGKVIACQGTNPIAAMPCAMPEDVAQLLSALPLVRGIYTFLVCMEQGKPFLVAPCPCLDAMAFFTAAADISLPEFLLADYVLYTDLPSNETDLSGIYRLCSYRTLWKKAADGHHGIIHFLHRKRYEIPLFSGRGLKKTPQASFARHIAQKGYAH